MYVPSINSLFKILYKPDQFSNAYWFFWSVLEDVWSWTLPEKPSNLWNRNKVYWIWLKFICSMYLPRIISLISWTVLFELGCTQFYMWFLWILNSHWICLGVQKYCVVLDKCPDKTICALYRHFTILLWQLSAQVLSWLEFQLFLILN